MVAGLWGNSQNLAALFALSFVVRVAMMAQVLSVVAASLEPTVEIAAMMAPDGATSLQETVLYALASLTPAQALRLALVSHPAPHLAPPLLVVVVAASGAVIAAIAGMTVQVGATSRAPTVQHVQGTSIVVHRHRRADELVESRK